MPTNAGNRFEGDHPLGGYTFPLINCLSRHADFIGQSRHSADFASGMNEDGRLLEFSHDRDRIAALNEIVKRRLRYPISRLPIGCGMAELPENITKFRIAAGLKKAQLARKVGVTRAAVGNWESGEATPTLTHVVDLASIFNCTIDRLMGDTMDRVSIDQELTGFSKERRNSLKARFQELIAKAKTE